MTIRQTDNTSFWKLVAQYLRAGTRDNNGANPLVPTEAMLRICRSISTKQTNP